MKEWLQVFRAQTAPATLLLIMTAALEAPCSLALGICLGVLAVCIHYISFGHNSLLDSCMIPKRGGRPYDEDDPNKSHHPLVRGKISIRKAKLVILWGYLGIGTAMVLLSLFIAANPTGSLAFLVMFILGGFSYNEGLSKETIFGFIPISICFTALAGWGWLITHPDLGALGVLYLTYVWFVILYQISWSGHLKEMRVKERSNLIYALGGRLWGNYFYPGLSRIWAWLIKGLGLFFAFMIFLEVGSFVKWIWFLFICACILFLLIKQTVPRVYDRGKELLRMSLMEVASIYLPIPVLVGWGIGGLLMAIGVIYFFSMNLILWGKLYPGV
ncbi:MAG: UbiA family prenyltransferase [Candidatus Caldarchaeum sp.]